MDYIEIDIPFKEIKKNPHIKDLVFLAIAGGASRQGTQNGLTKFANISNNENTYEELNFKRNESGISSIGLVIMLGGEVYNYNCYIKIDLSENVPKYIRGRGTWKEWIHENQSATEIDGAFYISSTAHYAGFKTSEKIDKALKGSELIGLINDGYTVLNKVEYKALFSK